MSTNEIKQPISPRKRRLKSAQDVRRYLADLINRVEADETDPAKAGRLAYITNILLSGIRADELEARLTALETAMQERRP